MANFPPYSYQTPMPMYGQQLQPMYQPQTYQPMQPVQPQQLQEQSLFCRLATNREEVLGVPVDFSGKPMTFLGPNLQTVWVKVFNPNTGSSDVIDFQRGTPVQETPGFVSMADFEAYKQQMAEELAHLRSQRRRMTKEQEDTDNAL